MKNLRGDYHPRTTLSRPLTSKSQATTKPKIDAATLTNRAQSPMFRVIRVFRGRNLPIPDSRLPTTDYRLTPAMIAIRRPIRQIIVALITPHAPVGGKAAPRE